MSTAPESLAAERFRELRKLDEKIKRLSQDLGEATQAGERLKGDRAAAKQRDREAYAAALAEGKGRPARCQEKEVAAELEDTELRVEALRLAVDSALDERAKLLKANHPVWRLRAMRELAKAKTRYQSAIEELEAARDGLSDEASLVAGSTAARVSLPRLMLSVAELAPRRATGSLCPLPSCSTSSVAMPRP
jgi:predicted S18 family serine protease